MSKSRRILNVILVLFFVGSVASGYIAWSAYKLYNSPNVFFTMDDPQGDDYGPGRYSYPTNSIFDPRKKLFDIANFTAFTYQDQYVFDTKFLSVTNPWGAAEGFSHEMIEIYIADNSSPGGRTEPLIQGANVLFDSRSPWTRMVKVVGYGKSAVYKCTDKPDQLGESKGVIAGLMPDKQTIRVAVSQKLLPGNPRQWKYYVLVGSVDGVEPDNFRKVYANVSRWNFGGGTDTDLDPNVIDLLASSGRQEAMLGSYDLEKGRLATIEPVRPVLLENTRWEKLLNFVNSKYSAFTHRNDT